MWNRKELKLRAKSLYKKNFWKLFVVSLLLSLLGVLIVDTDIELDINYRLDSNRISKIEEMQDDVSIESQEWEEFSNYIGNEGLQGPLELIEGVLTSTNLTIIFVVITLTLLVFTFGIRIFVSYAFEVGGRKTFIETSKTENTDLSNLTFGFGEHYWTNLKTLLKRDVFIFLWSLLLFIPGIIKSYQYRMVSYIIAENPGIESEEAFRISRKMTDNRKLDLFLFDLSFIGWMLLGNLLLKIGILFVNPYVEQTYAELYLFLVEEVKPYDSFLNTNITYNESID